MTSRERVFLAIEHRKTDRAPADYGAHQEVSDRLMARLGLKDHESLLQHLGVDMRRIPFNYYQPETGPDSDGYVRNMWGVRRRKQDPGDGRPSILYPFTEDSTVEDVHRHPWPDPARLDYSGIREQCLKFHGTFATFGAPWSPFFHEVGVDILDPIQSAAAGMDLPGLAGDFGDRLAFHGGVDTQGVLPFGSVRDVRAQVRSYLDLARDRGGYILCGSQEFIEDIPLDNILAMYDENLKVTGFS